MKPSAYGIHLRAEVKEQGDLGGSSTLGEASKGHRATPSERTVIARLNSYRSADHSRSDRRSSPATERHVVVVGGGPAGLMAAGQAALCGARVTLLEKMSHPARKLGITGKGRCNLTNVADKAEFLAHFHDTASFLTPSLDQCFADDLCDFVGHLGIALDTERGGRVFLRDVRAPQLARALADWARRKGVALRTDARASDLIVRDNRMVAVRAGRETLDADAVILATGGQSYPVTGSTGDGYALAQGVGHTLVPPYPALVPLRIEGPLPGQLSGLELRNVSLTVCAGAQRSQHGPGELSFTNYGITGPIALNASFTAVRAFRAGIPVELLIDLKAGHSHAKLRARLVRDTREAALTLHDMMRRLLPRPLVPVCLAAQGLSAARDASTLTPDDLDRLVDWLKAFPLILTGHRDWDEAIVTAGGIKTTEVNPATLESRLVGGLYLAGEVLDIQADTGGYNLQAAFSTGFAAGRAAAGAASTAPAPAPRQATPSPSAASKSGHRVDRADFLPVTRSDMDDRGWEQCDVILVSGDAYIDSPYMGISVIGRLLEAAGYRVGVIAQPDVTSDDITRLGEPRLFWGISGGSVDSMVANRTANGRPRKQDDYTPGGVNNRRPDRATIIYSNLVRQHCKHTAPIVLGGIEASLRRVAHYDFWSDRIRRSMLFDAKADYLLHGMAERAVCELADTLDEGGDVTRVHGLCYIASTPPEHALVLPSYSECRESTAAMTEMFHAFYRNNDPVTGRCLAQQQDSRFLIQNPPASHLQGEELDAVYELPYTRDLHPDDARRGDVRALDTIRCSITTHRGCYGECNFCAITVHQGRTVRWRTEASILREAETIASHPQFRGIIQDVGGPTANMYGFECARKGAEGCCTDKRCLYPKVCSGLKVDHGPQISLLRKLRNIPRVKQVVVASGVRHDLVLADTKHGDTYLRHLIEHHVSGQLKIAPEHSCTTVLDAMGKPGPDVLMAFKKRFDAIARNAPRPAFLTYYLIAAHPGCTNEDMQKLREFASRELQARPEQVQIFTPTPSTYATLMYWTEHNPFTGERCFVEKRVKGREEQKHTLRVGHAPRRPRSR